MKKVSLLVTFVLTISTLCYSDTIHVPGDHPTIQAGIDAAVAGDVVLVAPGTYVENIDFKGKAITVRSDIDGDPATHDISQETTIIDGGSPPDPDYGSVITFSNGEGLDSMLEGFTITNGTGTSYEYYPGNWNYCGGGIYCNHSSPTLSNNLIAGNVVGFEGHGGGICCYDSSPIIKNTIIADNKAERGGGIYCYGSSPTITNTTITGNISYLFGFGSGIYCYGSSPTITNTTTTGNLSDNGGGIYCRSDSSPSITNTTITRNLGGGIKCYNSSPTITNTTITRNTCGGIFCYNSSPTITSTTITGNSGGGINCIDSSPTITNTMITGNTAKNGGGISCIDSSPTITNTTLAGNTASDNGGGICCDESSSPIITEISIMENTAESGGGIYCNESSSPIITNTSIMGNTAIDGQGGGIHCNESSSPIITNTSIMGNTAKRDTVNTGYGGGIYCEWGSAPTLANTTITRNTAFINGGGICCDESSSPIITNLSIIKNTARNGGGIYCHNSSPTIMNTTLAGNAASNGGGGILCRYNSSPTVTNTILCGNTASSGPEVYIGYYYSPSTLTISYSNVKGGQASVYIKSGSTINWGDGMIDVDPLFVDPANNDFHLTFQSPCRGSGDNSATGLPDYDFEGNPRIAYGTVDIGADEFYTHLYCTGDFTPNGLIEGKLVGLPGTNPVGLLIGSGLLASPIQHLWGTFYLEAPWITVPFPSIPSNGVLAIPYRIPTIPPAPYDIPMQALIGWEFSNLFVLEVR